MTPRATVRALLCAASVLGGLILSALQPALAPHAAWAGLTLAVAIFLMDPPTVHVDWRRRDARAHATLMEAAQLRARAEQLDLKEHALRERERRLRERENALAEKAHALLRQENELTAGWARLRAEQARLASPASAPRVLSEGRAQVSMTPEEWLGVPRGAPPEQVRRAWLALQKAYHPDRVRDLPPWAREDAERRTKAINEAYDHLRAQPR